MKAYIILRKLFFGSSIIALAFSVHSADRYVPDEYPTIQAAVDAAEDGDTIHVAAGSYGRGVTVEEKELTIKGEGYGTTVIDGENTADDVISIRNAELELTGFNITGSSDDGVDAENSDVMLIDNYIYENDDDGVDCLGEGSLVMIRNTVARNGSNGVLSTGASVRMHENRILNNGNTGIDTYNVEQASFHDNTIADNGADGIKTVSVFGYPSAEVEAVRNLFENNGEAAIQNIGVPYFNFTNNVITRAADAAGPAHEGVRLEMVVQADIINNVINRCSRGIYYTDNLIPIPGSSICIVNNAITECSEVGAFRAGFYSSSIDFNLFYDNEEDNKGVSLGEHNLFEHPGFTPATDFHPQRDSVLVDAGDPEFEDPDGSRSDIGAYGGPEADRRLTPHLHLNRTVYRAGDYFRLDIVLSNYYPDRSADLYLLFEANGSFFFHPDYTQTPQTTSVHLEEKTPQRMTLLDFEMPGDVAAGGPFHFYALLTEPETYKALGDLNVAAFMIE